MHHVSDPLSTEKPKKQTNRQGRGGWGNKILRFEAVFAALNFFWHRSLEGGDPCQEVLISSRDYIGKQTMKPIRMRNNQLQTSDSLKVVQRK